MSEKDKGKDKEKDKEKPKDKKKDDIHAEPDEGDKKGFRKFYINHKEFNVDRRYYPVAVLGEGSYGVVCLCKDLKHSKPKQLKVAIKKCSFQEKFKAQVLRTLREIQILRNLDHPNLLQLKDLMPPQSRDEPDCVYLVMDAMETNLRRIIRDTQQKLLNIDLQILMWQLFKGLKYMHEAGLIHRDIKPSNLLVNADLHLKICDFGLSRGIKEEENEAMTEYVVTRHYRAPEVMTNPTKYDNKIDAWGAGCILGELLGREVVFPGTDYLTQLKMIIEVVGSPSKDDLDQVHPNARSFIQELGGYKKANWAKKYPKADPKALDLLEQLLQFNPEKRISATKALEHPWFQSMFKHEYFKELRILNEDKKATHQIDFGWEKPKMEKKELVDFLYQEIARYRPEADTLSSTSPSSTSPSSTSSTPTPTTPTSSTSTLSTTSTPTTTPSTTPSTSTSTSSTPSTSTSSTTSTTTLERGVASLAVAPAKVSQPA